MATTERGIYYTDDTNDDDLADLNIITKQIADSVEAGLDQVANAVPVGTIVAFGGSAAPAGWHLCDGSPHGSSTLQTLIGSANTPDLRGRFILGKSGSFPTSGGEATVTLTADQMPSHGHNASAVAAGDHTHAIHNAGSHNHTLSGDQQVQVGGSGRRITGGASGVFDGTGHAGDHTHGMNSAGSHSHTVTVNNTGGGQAHNNMPPYYSLVYIIKKA